MATFAIADGYQADLTHFDLSSLFYGSPVIATKKRYVLEFTDGAVDFRGTKFHYAKDGTPNGGDVEGYAILYQGVKVLAFGEFDAAVKSMVKAASTIGTSDDMTLVKKMLGGNDVISGANLTDYFNGYDGKDKIFGLGGADVLYGGAGKDKFCYLDASESTLDARDTIMDFAHGDKIAISAIAEFSFIGQGVYTGEGPQVGYTLADGDTYINADIDGDMDTDFSIQIEGTFALTEADFIL